MDQACACDTSTQNYICELRSVPTREHFCSRMSRWLLRLQWWGCYWHWLRVSSFVWSLWTMTMTFDRLYGLVTDTVDRPAWENNHFRGAEDGVLKVTNQRRGDISHSRNAALWGCLSARIYFSVHCYHMHVPVFMWTPFEVRDPRLILNISVFTWTSRSWKNTV